MECIDTSSLSTEVGQDDGDGAAESEGASDEPKGSTGSIPTGSSDAIKPSASPTNATASGNSTLIGGPARETLLPASDNEESNLVELPSGAVSSFIFNNQAFLMPILLASVFIHINYFK